MDITMIALHLGFMLWFLLGGAIVMKFSKRERSHISFVAAMMLWVIVTSLSVIEPYCGVVSLSFYSLIGGALILMSLCSYALSAIDSKLTSSTGAVLSVSPLILSIVAYVGYHYVEDIPLNIDYSLATLWEMRGSTAVILRVVVAGVLLLTTIISCVKIWQLISRYQNETNNIKWLRRYVVGIVAIMIFYLVMVGYNTPLTNVVYLLVTAVAFTSVIDCVIKHNDIDHSAAEQGVIEVEVECDTLREFYEWVESDKPYLSSEFSASVVSERFPELNYLYLDELLQRDGYSLQSYVRKCRIEESIRLIGEQSELSYKEIASMVGFKHYSSFCRAFVAVKGVSPKKL